MGDVGSYGRKVHAVPECMQCTRVHLNNALSWLGRWGVVFSRLSNGQTWATMRAPHSPFDLLAHIHDSPML